MSAFRRLKRRLSDSTAPIGIPAARKLRYLNRGERERVLAAGKPGSDYGHTLETAVGPISRKAMDEARFVMPPLSRSDLEIEYGLEEDLEDDDV